MVATLSKNLSWKGKFLYIWVLVEVSSPCLSTFKSSTILKRCSGGLWALTTWTKSSSYMMTCPKRPFLKQRLESFHRPSVPSFFLFFSFALIVSLAIPRVLTMWMTWLWLLLTKPSCLSWPYQSGISHLLLGEPHCIFLNLSPYLLL